MKLAIPVKTNKENPALSPLFGKAKYFAFVDEGKISIEKNEAEGGIRVIDWLLEKGVDILIVQHMGESPYNFLKEYDQITLFYGGDERILLDELIQKFDDDKLMIIDDSNVEKILGHH
jgi:predicted Fe-Mo cluster-binding NifX family protein